MSEKNALAEEFPELYLLDGIVRVALFLVGAAALLAWFLLKFAWDCYWIGCDAVAAWLDKRFMLLSAATGETVVRIAHCVSD